MNQSSIMNIGLLVVMIAVFYLLLIRPQKKREKEEKAMRDGLKVGDEVITIGGIVGTITKVKEKTVVIAVGADKTKIEFVTNAIGSVTKNKEDSPTKSNTKKDEKDEAEEAKAVNRDKKVAPKKLGKKSENVESAKEAVEEATATEEPAQSAEPVADTVEDKAE